MLYFCILGSFLHRRLGGSLVHRIVFFPYSVFVVASMSEIRLRQALKRLRLAAFRASRFNASFFVDVDYCHGVFVLHPDYDGELIENMCML